ncbi:MAG: right-handed parallel beta-helix repeat-containing protein [Thermoplasmatota archaeon]
MSNEEAYPSWDLLPFKDTTVTQTANFSYSGSSIQYHTYVKINNPAGTSDVRITAEIEEPEAFSDQMGFTILNGTVAPNEIGNATVDEWGSITHGIPVYAGETENFTVVYTLDSSVPPSNGHTVTWNFYEEDYFYTGPTVRVNQDPAIGDYDDISTAINDVPSGTTILVDGGTYVEASALDINKENISIIGAGRDKVLIEPPDGNHGLGVTADNVTLKGFTVQNMQDPVGGYGWGFKFSHCDNLFVDDVRAYNNSRTGFDLFGMTNSTLKNVLADNNDGAGISIRESSYLTVTDSRTYKNAWGGIGFVAEAGEKIDNITVKSSYIVNEQIGIYFENASYSDIIIQDNVFKDLVEQENIEYPSGSGDLYSGYVYLVESDFDVNFTYALNNNDFDYDVILMGDESAGDDGQAIVHLIE